MIEVDLPDGAVAEFPDGTPREVIQSSLQKHFAGQKQVGVVEDVVKSGGVGLAKGAIGLAGTGGDVRNLAGMGVDYLASRAGIPPDIVARAKEAAGTAAKLNPLTAALALAPPSSDIRAPIENVTGKFYEPKTQAGQYAQTVGEFIPGAMVGPGGPVRNAIAFGVIPGLASEFAGQQVKGTPAEPWVRGGAAGGAGIVAGVVSAPSRVSGAVSNAVGNIDRATLQQAENLFQEAQQIGMPITRAEAVQYVTNGATHLGDLQRIAEAQGNPRLKQFFAQRAGQTDNTAGQVFDQVSHVGTNAFGASPSAIGPAVGAAAENAVNGVRDVINNASQPFYTQAAQVRLTPQEMAQVRALPGYQHARDAVLNDPQLARYVHGLPEDSIGFLDEVRKQMNAAREGASSPLSTNPNMQIPAGWGQDAQAVRDAGVNASRRVPGNPYETALNIQSQAREQYLQPLLDGPLGKIAAKDTTTQKAIDVLFPAKPLANSADEIGTAVSAVAQRNPFAARNLVRAHLEATFNEATQNLASGVNSYGGAKFAAIVRGNPQQAANLEAAVRALPNGDNIWPGVEQFLTILEAQGQRQGIGSKTAFNQEVLQDLRQGKLAAEAGQAALTGGLKLPSKIAARVEAWRLGNGVDDIARLLTDPTAGREFARMANSNSAASTAGSIIRLVGLASRPAQSGQNPR